MFTPNFDPEVKLPEKTWFRTTACNLYHWPELLACQESNRPLTGS